MVKTSDAEGTWTITGATRCGSRDNLEAEATGSGKVLTDENGVLSISELPRKVSPGHYCGHQNRLEKQQMVKPEEVMPLLSAIGHRYLRCGSNRRRKHS